MKNAQSLDHTNMLVLEMGGKLNLQRTGELKMALVEALETSVTVSMRFGPDASADLSFLQLVCATHRAAFERDKTFRVVGDIPEGLANLLETSGYSCHGRCRAGIQDSCVWPMGRP